MGQSKEKVFIHWLNSHLEDRRLPSKKNLSSLLQSYLQSQSSPKRRPLSNNGSPGGLINLSPDIPVIILPDLHSRIDFLVKLLAARMGNRKGLVESLVAGDVQLLFLGDALHTEINCQQLWIDAYIEYEHDYYSHGMMDSEMLKGLKTVMVLLKLLTEFPDNCFFLKGNHENIRNENGGGNYPFGKFAREGEMVKVWMEKFYGEEVIRLFSRYEHSLPILARGKRFMASHAEPAKIYSYDEVLNYKDHNEVISGLSWTGNDASVEGSVQGMMDIFLGEEAAESVYIGGHRIIKEKYKVRANGRYFQIHNPERYNICVISPEGNFNPETDIFNLE